MKNKDKIIIIILFIVLIVLFIILIKPKNKLKTFCYNSYKIETFKQYNISNDGEALNFISKKYTITLKNIDQAFNIFEKEDFSSLNIQGKILNKTEKKYDDMNYIKLEIKDMKNKTYLLTQNQKKTWICSNKIDDVKDTLTDDNIGDSDNKLGDFLTGFQDKDPSGISGIVTVPLRIIKSFSTSQCKPFELDFYGDNKVSVPCVSSMISDKTKNSSQFKLFQTIMTGLVAYRCVKSLYSLVQRIKNPDDDRVEVLDL